jgi:hypothetical protein
MGNIILLSLFATFNPSLLDAVTVMLLLPSPKRLMAGYLLGALDLDRREGPDGHRDRRRRTRRVPLGERRHHPPLMPPRPAARVGEIG